MSAKKKSTAEKTTKKAVPEIEKTEATKEVRPEKAAPEKQPVTEELYGKYIGLKPMELSGAKLTDEQLAEIKELEVELKKCSGPIPIRTVRAAIGNEKCILIKGIPVPKAINDIITKQGSNKYYFGE